MVLDFINDDFINDALPGLEAMRLIVSEVSSGDSGWATGFLEACTPKEYSVLFTDDRAPVFSIGARVLCRMIPFDGEGEPVPQEGLVMSRRDVKMGLVYTIGVSMSSVTKTITRGANNRRSAFRLGLPEPVEVKLFNAAEDEFEGKILDISMTGVAILVKPAVERMLCRSRRVALMAMLPAQEEPLEIGGYIVHRRQKGGYVRYGLTFEPRTLRREMMSQLRQYIMRRQRLLIQRRTHLRG